MYCWHSSVFQGCAEALPPDIIFQQKTVSMILIWLGRGTGRWQAGKSEQMEVERCSVGDVPKKEAHWLDKWMSGYDQHSCCGAKSSFRVIVLWSCHCCEVRYADQRNKNIFFWTFFLTWRHSLDATDAIIRLHSIKSCPFSCGPAFPQWNLDFVFFYPTSCTWLPTYLPSFLSYCVGVVLANV